MRTAIARGGSKGRIGIAARRGFSLAEMLIVLAIAGVLAALALPSFSDLFFGTRLTGYTNSLVASAQLARSEALKRNAVVTLCASSNGTACSTGVDWEAGWIVLSGSDVLQRQEPLASGWKVSQTGGTAALSFQPTSIGSSAATLTVCRSSPVGSRKRTVIVNTTGSTRTAESSSTSCP